MIKPVILILALVRGNWLIPLLLAACAGWTSWLILTQLLPVWKNNQAYRKKELELQGQSAQVAGAVSDASIQGPAPTRQLPDPGDAESSVSQGPVGGGPWKDPVAFVTKGVTGRICVCGVLILTLWMLHWTDRQTSAVIWSRSYQSHRPAK